MFLDKNDDDWWRHYDEIIVYAEALNRKIIYLAAVGPGAKPPLGLGGVSRGLVPQRLRLWNQQCIGPPNFWDPPKFKNAGKCVL